MAEIVAEAFLTVVFEKLFEQLASPEFRKNSVASKLKELEAKLKKARLLLDDAEDRQVSEPSVKQWLDELKHVVFMADDSVEKINNKARAKKEGNSFRQMSVSRVIRSIYHSLAKTVQGEIGMILADLDVLLDRALVLGLKHGGDDSRSSRSSPRLFIAPLREEHHVFGREAEKDEILKMLFSDEVWGDNKIGVLPIIGMGGLGKTTLAQLVYDGISVEDNGFSVKAWVTVSTEFDFCRIMKELLRKVNPRTRDSEVDEPAELQRVMKESLRGRRFLFVLDDVWDENYDNWDLLMSNFAAGDRRSRVIVTTRSGEVGDIVKTGPVHELKRVRADDCWSIFAHHAFDGDLNPDSRLEEIGRRIVEKCGGLPLAVKSVGGLLRSERNPKKWENILGSRVWEWSKNHGSGGVLPSLWLSYRYLPSSLKQCFAYCSLFPQDYRFRKEKLVLLWMAEGFFQHEEVGEQNFDDLISRSLLQRSSGDESKFVMHDLVHDLAVFVSGESCFRFGGEESTNSVNLSSRTRHLSYSDVSADHDLLTSLSTAKHLSTFLTLNRRGSSSGEFFKKLVKRGKCLRVLSLFVESRFLHRSLGDLKHLRYLNLSGSNIEELPGSICSLFNLQTLLLSNCGRLTQLPMETGKLINLRHLVTAHTWLTKMPPKMSSLKELRTLTDFVLGQPGSICSCLKELGELRHLSGTICISKLQNADTAEDVRKANLRDKDEIKELILQWDGNRTSAKEAFDVLHALRPHINLERLTISGYSASSFPIWVGEISFSKMVYVKLRGEHCLCGSLPPLGQLSSLRELLIGGFERVEKVGYEFYGNSNSNNSSIAPFRCLETLEFEDMEIWKEWSFFGGYGNESSCFPRLKHLRMRRCSKLESESLLEYCGTLETLEICESYSSMEYFPLENFPKLKSLALSSFPNLKYVTSRAEDRLFPSLTSLEIRNCPEMESLPEERLLLSLSSLEIENCNKLVVLNRHWDLQNLTRFTSLSISNCDSELDPFPESSLPTSLTSFTLERFRHLKRLNESAFERVKSLKMLTVRYCNELEYLPEQALPITLCNVEIVQCPFLERRYQKDGGDKWHSISHIRDVFVNGSTTYELKCEKMERRKSRDLASTND